MVRVVGRIRGVIAVCRGWTVRSSRQAIGVAHDAVQDRLHPRWMKVVGSGRRHGC